MDIDKDFDYDKLLNKDKLIKEYELDDVRDELIHCNEKVFEATCPITEFENNIYECKTRMVYTLDEFKEFVKRNEVSPLAGKILLWKIIRLVEFDTVAKTSQTMHYKIRYATT